MDKRNPVFDWMRVISIFFIVWSHFLMFGGCGDSMEGIGHYLGVVFSIVFICISAFLFGLKWEKIKHERFLAKSFLLRRFTKIAASLYPYLIILFVVYVCFSIPFSVRKLVMNMLFLGWFDKIPANGHLWFITMIVFCYVLVYFLSKVSKVTIPVLCVCFVGAVVLQFFLDHYGFPGYMFLLLFVYSLLFLYAPSLLSRMKVRNRLSAFQLFVVCGFVMVNAVAIYMMYGESYDPRNSYWWLLLSLCGLLWVLLLSLLCQFLGHNKLVDFVSKISFELYIVHHVLCCDTFSIIHTFDFVLLNFGLLLSVSITLAFLLHYISVRVLSIR